MYINKAMLTLKAKLS